MIGSISFRKKLYIKAELAERKILRNPYWIQRAFENSDLPLYRKKRNCLMTAKVAVNFGQHL